MVWLDTYSNTAGDNSRYIGRRSRGTRFVPTAVQANDDLVSIGARGYGATAFATGPRALMQFTAAENWTDANQGTYMTFDTTPLLSTTKAERLRIDSTGNIGVGTTSPFSLLSVHAPNGGTNTMLFAIASSTATATTTLFSVDNTGLTTVGDSSGTGDANFQFAADANAWDIGYNSTDKSFDIASSTNLSSNVAFTVSKSTLNVGIGTTSPYAKLSLVDNNGSTLRDVFAISTSTSGIVFKVDSYGRTYGDGAYASPAADYAEYFYTNSIALQSGELVCVDVLNTNAVKRCERGADNNVMGIVSTRPSVIGNYIKAAEANPSHYAIIGMMGQVDAFVSAENGPINVGDSLTSASSTPGLAMRASGSDSTVGVALEPLAAGTGKIKVLISRRNKSLAVEEVEALVVERVANMKIEDRVNQMVAQSIDKMTVLPQLTVSGNISAGAYEAPQAPGTSFTLGSTTLTAQIPPDVLTAKGNVDLYKLATYNLAGVQALASRVDATEIRLASLTERVTNLENASTTIATTTVATSTPSAVLLSFATASGALANALSDALSAVTTIAQSGVNEFDTAVHASLGIFDKIFAKEVHTDNLCVGSVCVTQEQFLKIVQSSGSTVAVPATVSAAPPPADTSASGTTTMTTTTTTPSTTTATTTATVATTTIVTATTTLSSDTTPPVVTTTTSPVGSTTTTP